MLSQSRPLHRIRGHRGHRSRGGFGAGQDGRDRSCFWGRTRGVEELCRTLLPDPESGSSPRVNGRALLPPPQAQGPQAAAFPPGTVLF